MGSAYETDIQFDDNIIATVSDDFIFSTIYEVYSPCF